MWRPGARVSGAKRLRRFVRLIFNRKVFISYSHFDQEWVLQRLAKDLAECDFIPVTDTAVLVPGDVWRAEIYEWIKRSRAGIIVLGPEAVCSDEVQREIAMLISYATVKGLRLVPVVYRDFLMPTLVKEIHYVDFRDGSKYRDAFSTLVARLEAITPPALVFLFFLVAALVGALSLGGAWAFGRTNSVYQQLRARQLEVQRIDYAADKLAGAPAGSPDEIRTIVAEQQAEVLDTWKDGRLIKRTFRKDHNVLATDQFIYVDGVLQTKERRYPNKDRLDDLVDVFVANSIGTKLEKRHCPKGTASPCDLYEDDMASPMPPLFGLTYR